MVNIDKLSVIDNNKESNFKETNNTLNNTTENNEFVSTQKQIVLNNTTQLSPESSSNNLDNESSCFNDKTDNSDENMNDKNENDENEESFLQQQVANNKDIKSTIIQKETNKSDVKSDEEDYDEEINKENDNKNKKLSKNKAVSSENHFDSQPSDELPHEPNNFDKINKDLVRNGLKKEPSFYYLNLKWPNNSQMNSIFDQLRLMYIDQQLLDCTLVCEDQYIKAHKLLLAAVSPYFRSIFDSFNGNGCTNTAVILQNIPARDMRLIIKIIYSINNYHQIKLSSYRAMSLRKSAYRLKINFINDQLDSSGVPSLNRDLINNFNNEYLNYTNNLFKRKKRSYQEVFSPKEQETLNQDINEQNEQINKRHNLNSSSESADENSSECSGQGSMRHHKYKHRYLLSNEHLEQNVVDKIVKCGNNFLNDKNHTVSHLDEELLEREENDNNNQYEPVVIEEEDEDIDIEEDEDIENFNDNIDLKKIRNNLNNISPNHFNHSTSQSFSENNCNENYNKTDETNKNLSNESSKNAKNTKQYSSLESNYENEISETDEKVIDFSLGKSANSIVNSEEMLKLVNSTLNNADDSSKLASLYKALKTETKKLWNSEMNNDNLQVNNHLFNKNSNNLANDILNNTFSQLCMAGANLNPETARALLFTNELFKNNAVNRLHHSINKSKNSAENSLNTSTSSTNSSSAGQNNNTNNAAATAALVAAAQQQMFNSNFLGKSSSSNSISKQNGLNNVLNNNSKSNNSVSSRSLQNGNSSSNYNSLNSNQPPVKRGRGRPPRHTQPSGENSSNNEHQVTKQSSIKPYSSNSSLNNSTNSLVASSLNAFTQQKKWRPNIETLLAFKSRKNKLNSTSTTSNSPTNELLSSQNSIHNSQNQLINNNLNQSSSNNSNNLNVQFNSNNSNINNTSNSSTPNNSNNPNDGKNMCPYCPQVYYSNQAMNDHINNVHTKTAFKYICEFCSKEFSWKISLTKHLKNSHNDLNSFSSRSLNGLNVSNLNGLTGAITSHLGAAASSLVANSNSDLLHSFMNRDNESAMLNFSAIGD